MITSASLCVYICVEECVWYIITFVSSIFLEYLLMLNEFSVVVF